MKELEKLTGMVLKQAPIGEFDKRLVRLTREHGLKISKRTVSNYREELGIRSVYERKCP